MHKPTLTFIMGTILLIGLAGCAETSQTTPGGTAPRITLGAYTTPREAYQELIPLFQARYQSETGQTVTFEESYLGSGAQSRAIVEGFEADIAALSLQADIDRITRAGLITHDWQSKPFNGMVSTSVVVLGVRRGNPLGITGWHDLARPGLSVLTPNPQTSGGAMWNILAVYGAALRGQVAGVPADDPVAAQNFLQAMLKNVIAMDKSARESLTNFEAGIGDVIITYENEMIVGRNSGQDYEYIIPSSTIIIENPIAIIDAHVDKHGNRVAVEAFVDFLFTPQAQNVFARYGLRSPDPAVAQATAATFPPIQDTFTIAFFGGWDKVTLEIFGEQGVYTRAIAESQR